jgi:hypothetical protein
MSVPTLPILWAREEAVRDEYDAWRDDALARDLSAEDMRHEFFKRGVRARLGRLFTSLNAFTDEDGERKNPLMRVGDVFDAAPVPE